ncbi:MAG: acetyl-CoA C-acyltransferase [Chloroflexi bacterium]|nr:acetyl-CoA C-acyltransferase [Chloroflexota bacterium]
MPGREVVIIDGARTAIGRFGGTLRDLTVVDIGGAAMKGAVAKSGIKADQLEEIIMGHSRQAGNGPNPPRIAAVKAGFPVTVPVYAINQACLAGMQAVIAASREIALDQADIILAGGMEHHSSIPFISLDTRWGHRMGDTSLVDAMYRDGYTCGIRGEHMGALCDDMGKRYDISREEQDRFALESQQKAAKGKASGFYAKMIVPMEIKQPRGAPIIFGEDEHPRPDTTLETLSRLPKAFRPDGTITAGNASGITDGAAALVVMSKDKAEALGLKPLGTVVSYATAATEPQDFGVAPVGAVHKALARAGLTLKDISLVEINEAFAVQVLAVMKDLDLPKEKVNPYGGAIALGHPTGMSGARITFQLLYELEEVKGRYGLAAICGNGGQGAAMVLELAQERRKA